MIGLTAPLIMTSGQDESRESTLQYGLWLRRRYVRASDETVSVSCFIYLFIFMLRFETAKVVEKKSKYTGTEH